MKNVIETERCLLSQIKRSDERDIYILYKNENVRRFLGGIVNQNIFKERFNRMLQDFTVTNWTIRLKLNKVFVGMIGIGKHHDGQDSEISFQLLPEFWGKSFAEETVSGIIKHAANTMNLPCIIAETQSANMPSRKLLEKIGMEPVRILTRFNEEQVIYHKKLLSSSHSD